jgi:hypothetical protein
LYEKALAFRIENGLEKKIAWIVIKITWIIFI